MYINKILHTQALLTQKTLKTNAKSMLATCKLYVSNYFFLLQLSLDFDVAFCVVSVFFFVQTWLLHPRRSLCMYIGMHIFRQLTATQSVQDADAT